MHTYRLPRRNVSAAASTPPTSRDAYAARPPRSRRRASLALAREPVQDRCAFATSLSTRPSSRASTMSMSCTWPIVTSVAPEGQNGFAGLANGKYHAERHEPSELLPSYLYLQCLLRARQGTLMKEAYP
eukprot:scaffold111_cov156-Isochrysis_galbana.AAC.3